MSQSTTDAKHQRLKAFARARGVSLNKLVEEWATVALAQLDAENRYQLRVARGQPESSAPECRATSPARSVARRFWDH